MGRGIQGEVRFASRRLFLITVLCPLSSGFAAVFTNALTLSETNTAYDGQDIVIQGATVAIDGPHAFHSPAPHPFQSA